MNEFSKSVVSLVYNRKSSYSVINIYVISIFTDQGLTPYTEYHYALVVINTVGSTKSDFTFAMTSPSIPEGITAPLAEVRPNQLDTIYLTWQDPDEPNGKKIFMLST